MKKYLLILLSISFSFALIVGFAFGWGPLMSVGANYMSGTAPAQTATQKWATWTESGETTLATDTTYKIYVVFGEAATAATENEIGMGAGQSGATLVLTQGGSPAINAGPYRSLDGINDGFNFATDLFWNAIFPNQSQWTVIYKTYITVYDNLDTFIQFQDTDASIYFYANGSPGPLHLLITDAAGSYDRDSVDNITIGSIIWIVAFSDGVNTYGGWSTTRPTKLSDITANKRMTVNDPLNNFAQFSAAPKQTLGYNSGAGRYQTGRFYYFVASNQCLIDTSL